MDHVIEINNVSKHFRNTLALDNVSLKVPRGVVFAMLGENGAGKTTLIRNLLGLDEPDSGSLSILGLDPIADGLRIRHRTGYVPDAPALYDWMTVEQIAKFAASFYSPQFVPKFHELANEFELPTKQRIKNLSKGGQAKVSLALSMAHCPELLILDEPTSGLDTLVRRHFLESMIDVAAEGRTVFLSSHQINEVERVADWVAIIHQGKIVACATLEELKARFERWVVTLESPQIPLSSVTGYVVDHEGRTLRRQQLMLRDCVASALSQLREQSGVLDVEVHTPTLEEIFVALMRAGKSSDQVLNVGTLPEPEPVHSITGSAVTEGVTDDE